MDKFIQKIIHFIERENMFQAGDRVLAACSGGIDSTAMLHFLAVHKKRWQIEVAAVHVDHMLRGEESAADGIMVKAFCERLNIPFFGGVVPVPLILKENGGNVQDVCRTGRYALFDEIMRENGYGLLAVAHHSEDQLETAVMQLVKGVKMIGMPIERAMPQGRLIRPFMPVVKEELQLYVNENNIPFREDPSNASDAYMRNRIRHTVIPFIVQENAAAPANAVKLAKQMREDENALLQFAKEQVEEILQFNENGMPVIDGIMFSRIPTALQRRMIPLVLNYLYEGDQSVIYNGMLLEQIMHHISIREGSKTMDLPDGYQLVRTYDKWFFSKQQEVSEEDMCVELEKGVWHSWNENVLFYWNTIEDAVYQEIESDAEVMYFNLPVTSFPLYARRKEEGDRILLPGMISLKRVSRLFIDEKVPKMDRGSLPVIVSSDGAVHAVPGVRYGKGFTKKRTGQEKYIFIRKRMSTL